MATDPNIQITMVDSNMLEVCGDAYDHDVHPDLNACRRCGAELDPPEDDLHSCGYPEGTFACKIRHVQLNTGDAKAAKD